MVVCRLSRRVEAEHPPGVAGRGCRYLFGCRAFQRCDFVANIRNISGFVSLAAIGNRRQVGTVGFEHQVVELHFAYGIGQPALFEGHHTADAEQEVAALLQLPVGVGVFGEGVENTPQAQPFFAGGLRFRFDSAAHIFPGRPRMDGDGKVIGRGQAALFRECLELFGLEAVVPVVVESDFAHGAESSDAFGWRAEVAFDQRQLFPPTGIVVDGGRMQPHHRGAVVRIAAHGVEEAPVALGVDRRQQQPLHPGFAGAADRLVAVGVELFGVDMRVGVDQIIQCFGNFVLKYFVYRVGVSLF